MPWKEVLPMEQRVSFVLAVKAEEGSFAQLCRLYGISRKTGYKWWDRFCEQGIGGVRERSSRPRHSPKRSAAKWNAAVIKLREQYPWWGPKKLRAKLRQRYGDDAAVPAVSTLGAMLVRAGLVRSQRRRRRGGPQVERSQLSQARKANEVWAVDFKGWFKTGDGQRCEALTMSDLATRYVLCCRALREESFACVYPIMRRVFKVYGLPGIIRVDNGSPFASRGAGGLSRLSVWWMRLGITVEFITPGHPQENGSHERMHRTLKAETARPPASNMPKQQRRFDNWRRRFNTQRPHESLAQKQPAKLYHHSTRLYRQAMPLPPPRYPKGWSVRRVRSNGEIKWRGRKRFIGQALIGQLVGVTPLQAERCEVYFMERLLGALHEAEADFTGLRPTAYVLQNQRNKTTKSVT
jgi:transposase InsO family protein